MARVGWLYLEKETNEWHVNLADGYAITVDGAVATCRHCIAPEEQEMNEGYLMAFDASGKRPAHQEARPAPAFRDRPG